MRTMRGSPRRTEPRRQPQQRVPQQGTRPGGRDANEQAVREEELGRLRRSSVRHSAMMPVAPAVPAEEMQPAPAKVRLAPPIPVTVARTPFVVLVVMTVIAGVIGILMLNNQIVENSFRLDALHQEQERLNLRQQALEQDIAGFESPNNLAALAKKLGLVPTDTPAFIVLPDGKIIGVPQPASGTPSITSQ